MSEPTAAQLHTLAQGVRTQADQLRTLSVRIVLICATARWRSTAASKFTDKVSELALAMRSGANSLDDAAVAIELHAVKAALVAGTRLAKGTR